MCAARHYMSFRLSREQQRHRHCRPPASHVFSRPTMSSSRPKEAPDAVSFESARATPRSSPCQPALIVSNRYSDFSGTPMCAEFFTRRLYFPASIACACARPRAARRARRKGAARMPRYNRCQAASGCRCLRRYRRRHRQRRVRYLFHIFTGVPLISFHTRNTSIKEFFPLMRDAARLPPAACAFSGRS